MRRFARNHYAAATVFALMLLPASPAAAMIPAARWHEVSSVGPVIVLAANVKNGHSRHVSNQQQMRRSASQQRMQRGASQQQMMMMQGIKKYVPREYQQYLQQGMGDMGGMIGGGQGDIGQ